MTQPLTRAQALRADFDGRFAEAPPPPSEAGEELLAVRIGGDPYALRMAEIGHLAADRMLARLPEGPAAFLGLAGVRREILPVWDLGALLGYARSGPPPRWLAASRAAPAWGAAFDGLDACLKAPARDLNPFTGGGRAQGLATQLCATGGVTRPVLSFEKLLQATRQRESR